MSSERNRVVDIRKWAQARFDPLDPQESLDYAKIPSKVSITSRSYKNLEGVSLANAQLRERMEKHLRLSARAALQTLLPITLDGVFQRSLDLYEAGQTDPDFPSSNLHDSFQTDEEFEELDLTFSQIAALSYIGSELGGSIDAIADGIASSAYAVPEKRALDEYGFRAQLIPPIQRGHLRLVGFQSLAE